MLTGASGVLSNTSGVTINPEGVLTLDNTSANNNNRVNDAATVTLSGGTLWFKGNAAVASSRLLYDLAVLLRRLLGWEGAGFFVLGLVWFALAVAISATKAGIIRRLSSIVPQRKP